MKTLLVIPLLAAAMLLASCGRSSSPPAGGGDSTHVAVAEDYYTCPMHPQVHSPTPGQCPICGMDLVKASNSSRMDGAGADPMVPLSDRDQILANVATVPVQYEDVEVYVRSSGALEIAEPKKTIVSARFNGRIEQLHVDAVGTPIRRGDPMFVVYSPDLIQAQTEYLQALRDRSPAADGNRATVRSKLLLLGLTEEQIRDLEGKEAAPLLSTYRSPAQGVVIQKYVVAGTYISEGSTLFEVADLSTLWNVADIAESDARYVKAGDKAVVKVSAFPDEAFPATVSLLYPVVNLQTRTVKARLEVGNAAGKLRPNMFTETVFLRKMGRSLTIPVSAVLVTGKRNLVYVKMDHENHFVAREVGLGSRFGDKYAIQWGLEEGEVVVRQGGYLIDSESQLRSGSGM